MIKVDVSDTEVKITMYGQTWISNSEDVIKLFKEAKDDFKRRCLTVTLTVDSTCFKKISEETPKVIKKVFTLDILEASVHEVRKFSSNYNIDSEIDEFLGPDPYTPLY